MSGPNNVTPYTETEALLALLNDDAGRCEALLMSMYPTELASFLETVSELRHMVREAWRLRHKQMEDDDG